MTAYGFKSVFAPAIRAGVKRLTLRDERRAPSRHARPGETVRLWSGLRSSAATLIAEGVCTVRATVQIGPEGPRRVWDVVAAEDADDCPVLRRLPLWFGLGEERAHPDDFAQADGFETWAEAWAWHAANDPAASARGALIRELIGWTLTDPGPARGVLVDVATAAA